MSLAKLRSSLALWTSRLKYRRTRLAIAQRAGHKDKHLTSAEVQRIQKWKGHVSVAEGKVARRRKQIDARSPLRVRAWAFMEADIDAKIHEVGGNNRGHDVEIRIRANGGTPGEAWCGDEVAFVYLKAGAQTVTRAWASVWGGLERLLGRVISPLLGHVSIFNFGTGHTGLFKAWLTLAECRAHGLPERSRWYFWSGEGNTGDSGAVSDSQTGTDGVKLKIRSRDQVRSWRRVLR